MDQVAPRRRGLPSLTAERWGDLGLFLLFWLLTCGTVVAAFVAAQDGNGLEAIHRLAVGLALAINAVIFLQRGPSIGRADGVLPKVIALAAMSSSYPLSLVPISHDGGWLLGSSTVVVILVELWVIWSMLTLRHSFSIFPEARRLIRTGPYGLVRHPLYAAYFLTDIALLLPRWSLFALLIVAVGVGAQLWRVRYEEQVLRASFPEYDEYAHVTPRFVPATRMPWRRLAG